MRWWRLLVDWVRRRPPKGPVRMGVDSLAWLKAERPKDILVFVLLLLQFEALALVSLLDEEVLVVVWVVDPVWLRVDVEERLDAMLLL